VITMLVLTEQSLTAHDVTRISELHAPEPITAHVVVPCGTDQSTLDQIVDDLSRVDFDELAADLDAEKRSDAEQVRQAQLLVDSSVQQLGGVDITATGSVAPSNPIDAAAKLADELNVDEIIVVTDPHLVTDLLRRDWATRLRHAVQRPVLHFIAGTDQIVS
jgi:hypothetical protein